MDALQRRRRTLAAAVDPRVKLAVKAAFAAGVAWQLAQLFPTGIAEYAYYAPLGALLAMYPTVASSLKAGAQTVLGVVLGATIALTVDVFLPTNGLTVALLVGGGICAGLIRWLGEQRSWVPITALFVFTFAEPGSISYALGFVVLTVVGVVVGTVVNFLVFPPLHLRESRRAVQALQEIVSEQLEELAEGLERSEVPDREAWERRTRAVAPTVSTMHQALSDLVLSTRGNPRARRYRADTARQEQRGRAFRRIALLVEDLVNVLAEVEQADVPALPFDDVVRLRCALAMRRLAELAGSWEAEGGDADRDDVEASVAAACRALEELEDAVSADPASGGSDPFVAGSIVTTLRRCLGALVECERPTAIGGPAAVEQNRSRLFG
jgi:uncharacterized membrane protein YgaE (UPF0421/DUF939 family)